MKQKLLIILTMYYIIGLTSCLCKVSSTPFFDFDSFTIYDTIWSPNGLDLGTEFYISLDRTEYLSFKGFDFFNSAYAFQKCRTDQAGFNGPKYPILDIDVTCNRLYNDSVISGSSLQEYVFILDEESVLKSLNEINVSDYIINYEAEYFIPPLYIYSNDQVDSVFTFSFKITKTNGDIVYSDKDIVWN